MLGLLLGASVYTFSIILAVFLLGLGIGGGVGATLSRTLPRPRLALGWCQLLQPAPLLGPRTISAERSHSGL